jgi:hypothetical protein
VLAAIAAAAGRDCGYRIAARCEKIGRTIRQPERASFAICATRGSHMDAALAMASSLFRFASVASWPRFSHDPVNLAPDCDG